MSTASLHHILTERRADIISSASRGSALAPHLSTIQDIALTCLVSSLKDGWLESRTELSAAAKNAANAHSLAEQLDALDKLETAVLEFFQDSVKEKSLARMFIHASDFFREARGVIVDIFSKGHPALARHGVAEYVDQEKVRVQELYGDLHTSEQKYQNLIENAIDIIFILDMEGKFVLINKRAEEITGFKAEDWIGRNFSSLISPEDLPAVMESFSRGMRGAREILPVTISNVKGEPVHLQINSSPIEENRKLTGIMCIARDVTAETEHDKEFRKLHDSVVETNRKLEESMAALKRTQAKLVQSEKLSAMGELISGIAHELNNPLTGIIGYAQFLLEAVSDEPIRADLEKINHEAIRCKRIVQDLLEFACHYRPEKKVVDLNSVIRGITELREYDIRLDGINLITNLSDDEVTLWGDLHQLQHVILNLINNAQQAITANGIGSKIEISTTKDVKNDCIWIVASDDGPGIAPENLAKVFDPFFTTKEVGDGRGLGLSISYGVVQEHGGQISVESELGKGTIFRILLPLKREQ